MVLVVATLALLNRARARPWYRRPDTLGPAELAAFVLVPPLLPLLFDLDAATAGVTVVANLVDDRDHPLPEGGDGRDPCWGEGEPRGPRPGIARRGRRRTRAARRRH